MDKERLFQELYDFGVSEECALMYVKLSQRELSSDDALRYVEWLREDCEKHTAVQFAYLRDGGKDLRTSLALDSNLLGNLWGLWVNGCFWCRWHADTLTFTELKNWLSGRLLKKVDPYAWKLSAYERVRLEYFYQCAGSDSLNYAVPSVHDYQDMMPYIGEFSRLLKALEDSGCCVQKWFFEENYWAYDAENNAFVVFDINKGTVKPQQKNERYALRPIVLLHGR